MKQNPAQKIHLTPFDDIFRTEESTAKNDVRDILLSELYPFKEHPFQVRDDEEMQELVDSIKENGVLSPAVVRPRTGGGYELISGHRRKRACEIIGLKTMPAIVRDVDDDQAVVSMVDSNLQRETLLPSERAFAYKMKLDAMKRQGKRTDLTSCQVGTKSRADVQLAQNTHDSARTIQRYIRLTFLVPDLLKLVDAKKIAFNSAVELSYLKKEEQTLLLDFIEKESAPSLSQAQGLKKFSQEGKLTEDVMAAILTHDKTVPQKVTIRGDKLKTYFPPSYTPAQMETVILRLLKDWKSEGNPLK